MKVFDRIRDGAAARGETVAQAVRHHLLTGLITRVARTPEASAFVLRGGMLTRAWIAPHRRPTSDLDFVGDFEFSVEGTLHRLRPALEVALPDDVVIDRERVVARGIWLDSEFPGVHVELAIGLGRADQTASIDIGFRDPLVPEASWIEVAGTRVRAVRPETQVAWKLHCLAEMGTSWRPKDVADLWLITRRVTLEAAALPPAIAAAFESRHFTLDQARTVFEAPHWQTKTGRIRWEPYRKQFPELAPVVADLRAWLEPILADKERS